MDTLFIRNPRGASKLVIIDVALTGIDGQSRTSDEVVERPLQVRYDQKMAKYGQLAQQSVLFQLFFLIQVKFMKRSKFL